MSGLNAFGKMRELVESFKRERLAIIGIQESHTCGVIDCDGERKLSMGGDGRRSGVVWSR